MERSDYLVLVNKQYKLPADWEEKVELVEAKNSFGKIFKIEKETLEKFNELRADLLQQGIDIELDSVFRSLTRQKDIFWEFEEKYWFEYADKYVAPSGYSEHHTWLAIDICVKKENWEIISENHDMIIECEMFEKVHKDLWKYWFIVRYPDWKDNITWYTYEPRHFRYIWDANVAQEIYEKWLTLEEYLGVVKS